MRVIVLALILAAGAAAQFQPVDPDFQLTLMATALPGADQLGVDAAGNAYVFGTLGADGTATGLVVADPFIVPPGLALPCYVTFFTISGPTITGYHGRGAFRFE